MTDGAFLPNEPALQADLRAAEVSCEDQMKGRTLSAAGVELPT